MIEAILEAVPVTPAPSLLPCLLAIAMQPPIDIVQIISAQLTQHAQLEFMLTGIFEDIVPMSLVVAPGDDLSALALVLRRIEVATKQSGPMGRGSECLVDASTQIQLEVRIQLPTSIGILFEMIGGGDIDVRHFDFAPRTVQQREECAPCPVLPQFLSVGCVVPLTPKDAIRHIW